MTKKKRSIITISILLILIISLSILSFFISDKNNSSNILGITNYKIYHNSTIEYTIDNLIFIKNNRGKIELRDKEDNKYFELSSSIKDVKKISNGYIIYTEKESYILSNTYEIIYTSKGKIEAIQDDITNNIYYYETTNDSSILYDKYFNKVFIFTEPNLTITSINTNKVYLSNNKIYDISTKNELGTYKEIKSISHSYYLILNNDITTLIDKKNNKSYNVKSYYTKNNRYILSLDNKTLIIGTDNIIYEDLNTIKLNDEYYLDATTCKEGWLLKKTDNTTIYNECSYKYDISHIKDNTIIIETLNNKYKYLLNNKTSKEYKYISYEGDYLYAEDTYGTIIDSKGFSISNSNNLLTFNYIGNNQYIAYYEGENIKLLDNNLNTIETYDTFNCQGNICITSKDNKYGLYFNGKQQLPNKYINISKNKSNCVISSISYDAILYIDSNKKNKDLKELDNLDNNYYKDINIDKVIEEYHLEKLHDDIYKDSNLFKKYYYVIEHNNMINGYKDKILNLYKSIIENKNYLNEDKLLHGLKQLSIEETNNISIEQASGVYTDNTKHIEIKSDDIKPAVYYHELYHFLDYNTNYHKNKTYYTCNNILYTLEEYNNLNNQIKVSCNLYQVPETPFITEAGAEVYSSSYFIDSKETTSYIFGTYIYEILNYILGINTMKDIYYSPNTSEDFLNLLVKQLHIPLNEYENMINTFNKLTSIYNMNDTNILNEARDYLVYLYNIKYPTKNYTDDIEFLYYLKYGSGIDKYTYPYQNTLNNINKNILSTIYNRRVTYNIKEFKVQNNGTYIYFIVVDNNYSIIENIRVLYDFKNNQIIDYKRIEGA